MSIQLKRFLALSAGLLAAASAHASFSINFGLDDEFSGGTAPASTVVPWVAAEFETVGSDVRITLSAPNLTATESMLGFYFNFDDSLNVGNLSLTVLSSSGGFTGPTINRQSNTYKADGDGRYDIRLDFASGGNTANTFSQNDELVLLATYAGGVRAEDFLFLSAPAGGHGPFYAAAHIQNTPAGGGQSGWISASTFVVVPEPETLVSGLVLAIGALGWTFRRTAASSRAM